MPPEEAEKVQELIHQAMDQELSTEEQEEVWNQVFELLEPYTTKIYGI